MGSNINFTSSPQGSYYYFDLPATQAPPQTEESMSA